MARKSTKTPENPKKHHVEIIHCVLFEIWIKKLDYVNPKETEGGRNQDAACLKPPPVQ